MRSALSVLPCVLACCLQAAQAADFALNGRALGDRVDEVLNDPRYECGGVSACFLFTSCSFKSAAQESWHGVPLAALTLHYTGERIAAIEAQFAPEHFQRAAEASASEHGAPEVESPADGNVVYIWREGRRLVRLERLFAGSRRASLIIAEERMLDELLGQAGK